MYNLFKTNEENKMLLYVYCEGIRCYYIFEVNFLKNFLFPSLLFAVICCFKNFISKNWFHICQKICNAEIQFVIIYKHFAYFIKFLQSLTNYKC